jgi:signal transduction histidine kinase
VFFALRAQLVRPMRRLVASMAHFQEAPEDPDRQIQPCGRSDEVGEAEAGLAELQTEVRRAFRERKRLAELGQAVAKINHDLRNILASAQLISDRLRGSDDPLVRRMGPKLYSSIDRAQRLCSDVLKYGKAREETARKVPTPLRAIVRDAVETARAGLPPEMTLAIDISPTLVVDADPDQLHRMVLNLVRNALQAMERAGRREGQVVVAAGHEGSTVYIDVTDTGPGIKEDTVDALFEPFNGGARGSGLGLAIVRDLALGHGGDVKLMASSEAGTRFRIILPDGQEDDLQVSSTAARDAAE